MSLGPVTAQSAAGPEELWTFDPPGDAAITSVAMDATGSIAAASRADAGTLNFGDDEVYAWDLAASPGASSPVLEHDPRDGIGAPEGLGVVAVTPAPNGKADLVAVGREGSDTGSSQNQLYIYQISRGPAVRASPSYPSGQTQPEGAVQALYFTESGNRLLVHHADALSLLVQKSGTQFDQKASWSPASGETIRAIAVNADLSRVVVATFEDSTVGADVARLRVFEVTGEAIRAVATPLSRSGAGAFTAVDVSDTGDLVVAGTDDRVVFYYQLQVPTGGGDRTFSTPWSRSLPAAVTSVALSENGTLFAAGTSQPALHVFRLAELEDAGPLAERASKSAFAPSAAPQKLLFLNNGSTLLAQAGALYAFNRLQFDPAQDLTPLWNLPNVAALAASRDGNRFVVATGDGRVHAFRQSYDASLEVGQIPQAKPGETLRFTLSVTNAGSAFDEYFVQVQDLPGSWSAELSPELFALQPGEMQEVQVNLTPSAGFPPGDVPLALQALSGFSPDEPVAGSRTIEVNVLEVRAATVEVDETDFAVERGVTATFTTAVTNAGNVAETILLEVRQERNWAVTIEGTRGTSSTFELEPAAERIVTVRMEVPGNAAMGSTNVITLKARPQAGGTEDTASFTMVVEPDFGVAIAGPTQAVEGEAGEEVTFDVTVANGGNTQDTISLRTYSNATRQGHLWEARVSEPTFELDAGKERTITVTVDIPRGAEPGDASKVTLVARSEGSGSAEDVATFDVTLGEDENGSPLGAVLVPVALLGAALAVRRRDS